MCGRERIGSALLALLLLPAAAWAQTEPAVLPPPAITVVAGPVSTDFGEVDPAEDGFAVGLRLDFPLSRIFVLEASGERLSLDLPDDDASVRWQADFAVRAEFPLGSLRPFVGGSLGALLWPGEARPSEADFVTATYGGLAGVRYRITDRLGVRGEARLRWLDGLESRTTTLDAGLTWRF